MKYYFFYGAIPIEFERPNISESTIKNGIKPKVKPSTTKPKVKPSVTKAVIINDIYDKTK
jgi:hypothetical protein